MKITDEQKQAANSTDLVSYLESKGFQFKKVGTSYKPIVRSPYSGDGKYHYQAARRVASSLAYIPRRNE